VFTKRKMVIYFDSLDNELEAALYCEEESLRWGR